MFLVLGIMLTGILVGFLLRSKKIGLIHQLITTLIWLLLFLLGAEVGTNETLVKQFGKLGFEAFLLAAAATFGSVCFAGLLWMLVRNKVEKNER